MALVTLWTGSVRSGHRDHSEVLEWNSPFRTIARLRWFYLRSSNAYELLVIINPGTATWPWNRVSAGHVVLRGGALGWIDLPEIASGNLMKKPTEDEMRDMGIGRYMIFMQMVERYKVLVRKNRCFRV